MITTLIAQRLAALREEMRRERLGAFILPTSDPHDSEYTADHWKGREWVSGFTGSAGTAVVTLTGAALWTDSRYFIQAADQLRDTEFQLMKLKMEGTPTIAQWIGEQLRTADTTEVGIDGTTVTTAAAEQLKSDLRREGGLTLRTNLDILQRIWRDRPPIPRHPVGIQPAQLAGEDVASKLRRIRRALRERHADGMLVARLDDIAWTLNLRGSDVHCTPVFVAYLLIDSQRATLFVDPQKLSVEVNRYLAANGIATRDYTQVGQGLKDYFEYNILLDPDEVNYYIYNKVEREVVRQPSPIPALKAVKNRAEQDGFRRAMLRDGVALVRWLRWLDESMERLAAGVEPDGALTEIAVADKLEALRAEQPMYCGPSFDTIAGYEAHGAIVHYEATPATDVPLQPRGLLLVDSGGQYLDGTTDVTRTIALGPLSDEQRRVYTLVLRGHIRLAMLHFPDGACGSQLDAIARQPLWQAGLNFLHGTGHGVGSYLSVHEGPHQIRMEWRPAPLRAGMTVTDEPGIYLEGRFGVRIENTLLVQPAGETECGRFLRFEPLTLCPIDRRPILRDLLLQEEIDWLDRYHATVCDRLSPHLDADDRRWLLQATRPL